MWWGWWAFALTAPLLPTDGLTVDHAGRLWLIAVWLCALGASGLGAARRWVEMPWVAWTGLAVSLVEACRWWQGREAVPWLFTQGAWWDTAGWWVVGLFGTTTALQYAPFPSRWVPVALCAVLSLNLLAVEVEWRGISRWAFSALPYTGLFAGSVPWAAWCAISLPVLWAWKRWAIAPAVVGLCLAPTTSAWLASGVWAWWTLRRWSHRLVMCAGLAAVIWWQEPLFALCLQQRLDTWAAVVRTITEHPWGIGWGFGAYRAVVAHATGPILPHPASDWLSLILRYGWWMLMPCAAGSVWLWHRRPSPWKAALLVAWWLAAWQTSVSLPVVGALVWVAWMTLRLEETHGQEAKTEPAA